MISNNCPVYYHIPKCGGTYIYSKSYALIKELKKQNFTDNSNLDIFFIHIFNGSHKNILFRILVIQNPQIFDSNIFHISSKSKKTYNVNINDLKNLFQIIHNNIYLIIITPEGFLHDYIIKEYLIEYNIQSTNYMSVRNPYDRALSMYQYLISDNSKHELTHYNINPPSFSNFLIKQKNWIIQNILSQKTLITNIRHEHWLETIDICKDWFICDISNIDNIIYSIFSNYKLNDLDQKLQKKYTWVNKNETNYDYIPFTRLKDQARLRFLNKTRWDREFYAYFT